jgi:hypothetical protein
MQRIFGALAIFGGWLSIPLGAAFLLIATQGLGLYYTEGPLPPAAVYGLPDSIILWLIVVVAVLGLIPAAMAMIAADPSRKVNYAAAAMAVLGIILLGDELGRMVSLALLPGAALLAVGAHWLHQASAIEQPQAASVPSPDTAEASDLARAAAAPETGLAGEPRAVAAPAVAAPAVVPPVPTAPELASGRSSKGSRGKSARAAAAPEVECPWCSARIAQGSERCPSCGAGLIDKAVEREFPIAGVTAVAPELVAYAEKAAQQKKKPGLLSTILDQSADLIFDIPAGLDQTVIGPPSAEVRAEMERLDREIAAARANRETVVDPIPPAQPPAQPPGADASPSPADAPRNQDA